MKTIRYVILAVALLGFVWLAVTNVTQNKHNQNKTQLELKLRNLKLIDINKKYEESIKQRQDAEKKHQDQIKSLEGEIERLQRDLQTKRSKSTAQAEKPARRVENASGGHIGDCVAEIKKYDWNHGVAIAVAQAESGLRPNAHNFSHATKDNSWGCFQINIYGNNAKNRPPASELIKPSVNVAFAYKLYKANGESFKGQWGVCRKISCY